MASGIERVRLVAPSEGIDNDSAPASVKPTKALALRNYLTGEPGRVRQRGGIEDAGQSHGITDKRVSGAWNGRDRVLFGFVNAGDATRVVPPWRAPIKNAAGSQLANTHATTPNLRRVDLKTPAVSSIANVGSERSTGPSWNYTRVGRFVYGFAFDSDNDIVTPTASFTIGSNDRGGFERLTHMLRWDVTGSDAPVVYFCGPYGAQDLIFHYNKLLVLGGRQPETGGSFVESNVIWYTREWSAAHHNLGFSPIDDRDSPGGQAPAAADAAYWPGGVPNPGTSGDCTFGAVGPSQMWYTADTVDVVNRLNLPGDESDFGVGFAPVGRNLAVFKRRAIVLLVGFGEDSWSIRTSVSGIGCLDPRSIVPAREGAFFLSSQGFMFFDGVQVHDASKGVHRSLVQAGLYAVGDDAPTDTGFACAELLDNEHILLTIGDQPHGGTPATPTVTFCGLYHIPSASWTTFDAAPFATTGDAPIHLGRSDTKVWAADHSKVYTVPYITTPDNQTTEANRGKDGSDTIQTEWHSKVVELASPFEDVHHKRLLIDYEWSVDGSAGDDPATFDPDAVVTTRPKVEVRDGAGNLVHTFYLPAGPDPSVSAGDEETYRQRFVYDFFADVAVPEIQVRIEFTGTATALVRSAIHDVWLEYTTAQERRNR